MENKLKNGGIALGLTALGLTGLYATPNPTLVQRPEAKSITKTSTERICYDSPKKVVTIKKKSVKPVNRTNDRVLFTQNKKTDFFLIPEVDYKKPGNEAKRLEEMLNLNGNGKISLKINGKNYGKFPVNNGKVISKTFNNNILKFRNHRSDTFSIEYDRNGNPIVTVKNKIPKPVIMNYDNDKKEEVIKNKVIKPYNKIEGLNGLDLKPKTENKYILSLGTDNISNYPSIYNSETGVLITSEGFDSNENWNGLKIRDKWSKTGGVDPENLVFEILSNSNSKYAISGEIFAEAARNLSKYKYYGSTIDLVKNTNLEKIIGKESCMEKESCSTLTPKEMKNALYNIGAENAFADYLIEEAKKGNYSIMALSKFVSKSGFTNFLDYAGFILPLNTINNESTNGTGYVVNEKVLNNINKINNYNNYKSIIDTAYNKTMKTLNLKYGKFNSNSNLINGISSLGGKLKESFSTLTGGNKK